MQRVLIAAAILMAAACVSSDEPAASAISIVEPEATAVPTTPPSPTAALPPAKTSVRPTPTAVLVPTAIPTATAVPRATATPTTAPTQQQAPPATPPANTEPRAVMVANGSEVYTIACARCHAENGMGTERYGGLIGVGSQYSSGAMIAELTSGHVVTFGFADKLSADEIASVVAYVKATFP